MTNVFASDVQKQDFMNGVQDEIRTAIPMAQVSHVDTKNLETMHNRYGSDFYADSTTDGTYSVNDFEYSNDSLPISEQAVYGERIQLKELVHSGGRNGGWGLVADRVDRHVRALGVRIHRDTYEKTVNGAGLVLDNEVLAGSPSAGTPITVSATNPDDISTKVYELMQNAGLSQSEGRPYFMIDPATARQFKLHAMSSGFNVADRQLMTGFELIASFDFDYFITPEVEHEQVLTESGAIIADETVTVAGVVFTFKAAPSAAGEVDLGADDEESLLHLSYAINGTGVAGTDYIELSASDRQALKAVKAVATAATSSVTVTAFGSIAGAETGVNLAWGTEQKNLLAGLRNSTHLALPSEGYMVDEIDKVPGFTGSELRSTQVFDSTVWTKNANRIAKIIVAA